MKEIRRERKRKQAIYPLLSECAYHLLQSVPSLESGQYYNYMASIIFSAFTMEAFINHLGSIFFSDWDRIERNLSQAKRREKIYGYLNIEPDNTQRPYSTIDEIFSFRDSLAHGKRIVLEDCPDAPVDDLRVEWEKYCTKENAEKAKSDVLEIIKDLFGRSELEGSALSPADDVEEWSITERNT